jgi:putative transposase
MKNKEKEAENTSVMRRYEYRIYPSETQADIFVRTFGCVRFVYNRLLREKIDFYEKTKKTIVNTPKHLKSEFPWLAEVDSLALCNAQIALQSAFANFFRDRTIGFPRFKSKKNPNRTYMTNYVNGNIGVVYDPSAPKRRRWKLKLPKVGLVDIAYHRSIPDKWSIKSVTVKMSPSGQFYASVLCDTNEPPVPLLRAEEIPDERIIGLDYSMPALYVSSCAGIDDASPVHRFFRTDERKIAREKRKLAKCKKGSKNEQKQKKRVARLEQRVADRRKDFLHQESRRIANAFDVVCVEDIDMRGMSRSMNFGKSVHDNGWGMFRRMLEYKLAENGGLLIKVGRFYPSSKTCSVCGSINNELKLSDRSWMCGNCGTNHDRDINAAINIRNEGLRILKTA